MQEMHEEYERLEIKFQMLSKKLFLNVQVEVIPPVTC